MEANKNIVFDMNNFRLGKLDAYQQIFHLYYTPLCLFLTKMNVDAFVAEEIVQDAFLKVWDKRQDFEELHSLRSFLYITCKNAALNLLDKEKRSKQHENTYEQSQIWVELPISQQIIYSEVIVEIHTAIDQLPEQCKKVMQCLFVEGLSPSETADELGLSASTIYNQKMRGVKLLKELLSKDQLFVFLLLFWEIPS